MKEVFLSPLRKLKACRYESFILILVLMVLIVVAGGFGFTKEKAQKVKVHRINSEDVRIKNIGYDTEALNPLRKDEYSGLNSAVEAYLSKEKEKEAFVEKYDDIHIYTKIGQYRDTYIVFAEYHMKIKDIYTEVPGLVTLYAVKDEKSGQYQIYTKMSEEQDTEYVRTLTGHKDVKELLCQAKEEYDRALQDDALLREALADLKNAYENSDG